MFLALGEDRVFGETPKIPGTRVKTGAIIDTADSGRSNGASTARRAKEETHTVHFVTICL